MDTCDKIQRFPGDADTCELFPDQNSDKRFNECAGESVGDVVGNIVSVPMHPGYSFAAAQYIQGKKPSDQGVDLLSAMDGAVAYGVLPLSDSDFDALTTSSLYEADFLHYDPEQRRLAQLYAQKSVTHLTTFDEIVAHVQKTNSGVVMGMKWYQTFNVPPSDGELPEPGGSFSQHAVAVYGTGRDGMMRIKPWLGPKFGAQGYVYMTRAVFQKTFLCAFGFDPHGIRTMYLLGLAARRYPYLLSFLPTIISNLSKPMITNEIYSIAAQNIGRHLTLNRDVPGEVGCAEAVSWILLNAGYPIPHGGIQTVNGLIDWLQQNGFQEVYTPVNGAIITAHSPNHADPNFAHTGVCLSYGVGSNDSDTGLFKEGYTYQRWNEYFGGNGSVIRYFYHK